MRRLVRVFLPALCATAVAVSAFAVPAFAQTPQRSVRGEETSVPAAAVDLIPGMDPALVGLPITAEGAASLARLEESDLRLAALRVEASELEARRHRLDLVVRALEVEEARHARELADAELRLGRAAASAYKSAGSLSGMGVAFAAEDATELAHGMKLSTSTAERLSELSEIARAARRRAGAASRAVAEDIVANEARLDEVAADVDGAIAERDAALDAATGSAGGLTVRGTDLPLVVLDAYVRASRLVGFLVPECRLSWWTLAGIGKVESNHARFRRARTNLQGRVEPPIIGIALDGAPGVALIGDSDGGLLDGDQTFDRAVGPMQFIPTTWARWAEDGNGDGVADPHNIYDAALAAGLYLCASAPAGGLVEDVALVGVYLTYNHSIEYAGRVLAFARAYQAELGPLAP